jgi:hypothetical protein
MIGGSRHVRDARARADGLFDPGAAFLRNRFTPEGLTRHAREVLDTPS